MSELPEGALRRRERHQTAVEPCPSPSTIAAAAVALVLLFCSFVNPAKAQSTEVDPAVLTVIINMLLDSCVDMDRDTICAADEAKFDFLSDENPNDALDDEDNDGLNNRDEINLHRTNPDDEDSDDDDSDDGEEIANGTDPNDEDTDDDGVKDGTELALSLNPLVVDDQDFFNFSAIEKRTLHILNRTTFGPTKELLDEVDAAGGIDSWLSGQLVATGLPAAPPRTGANSNPVFNNDIYPIQYDCSAHSTTDPAQAMRDCYIGDDDNDLDIWGTIRPLHSNKQLQSRMALFWDNHFNTDEDSHGRGMQELYDEDDFFTNAFGSFLTLLDSSARSYSMLEYLDLDDNRKNAPNENYPREVLELYATGIDGGYDAFDIAELARILTGWDHTDSPCVDNDDKTTCDLVSRYGYFARPTGCENSSCELPLYPQLRIFDFRENDHDDGQSDYNENGDEDNAQKVLTVGVPPIELIVPSIDGPDGVNEGLDTLEWLAEHPSTALFVCTKLAQEFVSDLPALSTLDNCVTTFLNPTVESNQMGEVLVSLLTSSEFDSVSNHRAKLQDTQEVVFSLGRYLQWQATHPNHSRFNSLAFRLRSAEQPLFTKDEPTGYYETGENWLNTNIVLEQHDLLHRMVRDWDDQSFESFGGENDDRVVAYLASIGVDTLPEILEHLFLVFFGGYYDGYDIQIGFDILNGNDLPYQAPDFDFNESFAEDRIKRLMTRLVTLPAFHMH
ncbi:MAG: DUF1800 family protein [Pseudomonadota bacterium]